MGVIERPDLPPGARRDLNQELHTLHRRAGLPSVRELAKAVGKSASGVHNAFRLAKVPEQRLTMAIVDRLTLWVRDWGVGISQTAGIEKTLRRFERLWHQAKYEEEALAGQGEPPRMSDATRRLLFALSPECSMSHPTRQLPQPHDIVALEEPAATKPPACLRKTGLQPESPNPWHLIHLCRGCQRRRETGELTEPELRAARSTLDRRPGAARHYAAYLDQMLLGAEGVIDMNVAGAALAIVKADPEMAATPYALNHGEVVVDRTHGCLQWGHHPCEDDH
ncbi:hypothetical protein [Streptomyces fructofermentans]|uniref:Uncharacterized protein n=1 Tax=Streptomyces fructofermentans TaxID=152141 RepID=A0A918NVV7_9ACTN|nr:hypothetical protein [Streptomyces fructofermentans]GGX99919.1 hypothetical protein GCM10010515_77430 [Streptomyces fructofermentans]